MALIGRKRKREELSGSDSEERGRVFDFNAWLSNPVAPVQVEPDDWTVLMRRTYFHTPAWRLLTRLIIGNYYKQNIIHLPIVDPVYVPLYKACILSILVILIKVGCW